MIDGDLYIAFGDEGLETFEERQYAKEVLFDYNSLRPSKVDERNKMLENLLGSVDKNFYIEPPFRCDYGYNIFWGEGSYANYNLTVLDCAKVNIGKNVLIGPNVNIFTAGHPVDPEVRASGLEFAMPITIGDNVWIGGASTINPGVSIGENSVIASGSIVTKDIPSNVVAAGNPCKVIRSINEGDKKRYFKGRHI
ncbi:Galactoside O-acetyltransferase [bioreactor metagenome]|uniref:Galactoside O-acetyltransferase n=2 Tax=root TaxID=1 RepID=A0A645FVW5_9ZZZZ|nr:sugar O-acetyltransferase [Romboutsia lituseburensis]